MLLQLLAQICCIIGFIDAGNLLLERRFLLITRLHSALECKHLFACELEFAFSLKITVEYWGLETSSFN